MDAYGVKTTKDTVCPANESGLVDMLEFLDSRPVGK